MTGTVRLAAPSDVERLRHVEVAAGEAFRALDMDPVADDEPPSVELLLAHVSDGTAWVVDDGGAAVAYLLAGVVDGEGHVDQVSVHPDHAGHGHGQRLLDRAARWAVARGLDALKLTTFAEVPWNAPYYERLGFRAVADTDLTAGLREVRIAEAAAGLDRWPRVVMRRALPPG